MDDSARLTTLEIRIADLERKLDFVMQRLNLEYHADPLAAVHGEVTEWLRKGNKLEAIKAYREATGQGLKEAKDAVEEMERRMRGR
jgi:ribosomal protein L7/L12